MAIYARISRSAWSVGRRSGTDNLYGLVHDIGKIGFLRACS